MIEWFEALTTLQQVLFAFASVGSLLFLIQIIAMLVGIVDTDAHADVDVHGSADIDADGMHADSDVDFKVISIQGIIAFFMMLGWVGLAMNRSGGFGTGMSIAVGCGAGVAMNFIIAKVFQAFKRMQSSGTMDLKNAIGQEGNVYLTIKKDAPGKVQMAVQQHLKVFDAVSDDGEEIPTDTRVAVVRVVKGNTMVVKKV
jgi:hypothetical protein